MEHRKAPDTTLADGSVLDTLARQERAGDMLNIRFGRYTVFVIVTALQLACRHPDMSLMLGRTMRNIANSLTEPLPPAAQKIVNRGWDRGGFPAAARRVLELPPVRVTQDQPPG